MSISQVNNKLRKCAKTKKRGGGRTISRNRTMEKTRNNFMAGSELSLLAGSGAKLSRENKF